jgi:hypothetical protein
MAPTILAAASTGELIAAGLTLLLAVVLVVIVHRAMGGRGRPPRRGARRPEPAAGARHPPAIPAPAVEAFIIVVGVALAIAQFTDLDRLAGTVLASSALAAAVVGFASRQVLANAIAGVVLAVTQPLRIGDVVTFEDQTGTVEDVTLTYTWLRTGSDARTIIPNERLAAGVLRNDSIRSPTVALEVTLWLAPEADEAAAVALLGSLADSDEVRVADVTEQAVKVVVAGPAVAPPERHAREAALRAAALRALREAGIPRAGTSA